MTNPEPLPPNLRELERLLARRPRPEPGADFRGRVLGAMTDAAAPPDANLTRRGWRVISWVAAALIAVNLWMSVANGIRFHRLAALIGPASERPAVTPRPDAEDPIESLAANALANLTPAPDPGAGGRAIFISREDREWGTR